MGPAWGWDCNRFPPVRRVAFVSDEVSGTPYPLPPFYSNEFGNREWYQKSFVTV
jgi:hypothetical protein